MPELRDHPAFDTRVPYYDRTPENRATRAALVKFVDAVGTHLICPRKTCGRTGRCTDRDARALPFCWEQYRGMLRFLLKLEARHRGLGGPASANALDAQRPGGPGPAGREDPDPAPGLRSAVAGSGSPPPGVQPPGGGDPSGSGSLLGRWAARGAPIEALARAVADGPDDWDWERNPELTDLFGRLSRGPGPAAASPARRATGP